MYSSDLGSKGNGREVTKLVSFFPSPLDSLSLLSAGMGEFGS